jgi:Transposase
MEKTRRQFTPQQKVAILREHLVEHVPVSDLCDKHKLHPTLFYQWQKAFFEHGAGYLGSKEIVTYPSAASFRAYTPVTWFLGPDIGPINANAGNFSFDVGSKPAGVKRAAPWSRPAPCARCAPSFSWRLSSTSGPTARPAGPGVFVDAWQGDAKPP